MSYRSEYYLEEFENDEIKKLIIILNRIEIHNKKKYLLIVAKDLGTNKIVKLIDTHGSKHNLCKYCDDWALLNKGDVISVKCEFYKSQNCVNVLRIKSNYVLSESIDLHESLKATALSLLEENTTHSLMTLYPDLENIGKKHPNKYGFILYYFKNEKLIEYKKKDSTKIKYQFPILCHHGNFCYADIVSYIPNISNYVGQAYTGFVLLQFAYINNRVRAKVYDLLGDDSNFGEYVPFPELSRKNDNIERWLIELNTPTVNKNDEEVDWLDDDLPF